MAFLLFSCFFFFFFFPVFAQTQPTNFIFNGFNGSESNFTLDHGASISRPAGALKLTNKSRYTIGHAFYSEPIGMPGDKSSSFSFSTTFVLAIVPSSSGRGGYGLAFTLSPSKQFPGAVAEHYMGIFNPENDGSPSNHIFAVEFDTVNGHNEGADSDGNHVGININSMDSTMSRPAAYFINNTEEMEELVLESGDRIQAWIEYDGNFVNVTICPLNINKPSKPLISYPIDLAPFVQNTTYVGFSASTGVKTSSHFILGWSFSTNGTAPVLDISALPMAPSKEKNRPSYDHRVIGLIAALSTVTVLLLGILICFTLYKRNVKSENLEDWELDCPHRFRYKDLHAATKGFKQSEVTGVGGFAVGFVLNWQQRFNIIKGIAAGLLYLHEEWELVVVHRDVKSSNVLIDADMNARLGDFGLARLYDHGTDWHTTNVVGTIGYIAPELARNGKASTSSDVFAFGVLLLEIVTGRKPVDSRNFFLVDWVIECHQKGHILDAMDAKLNSSYVVEEVKLVLLLGLLCSHPKPEIRPSMRRIARYLNGDEHLPAIDNWDTFDSRDGMYAMFLETISSHSITKSYRSSSTGGISSSSMNRGR
ncbi:hypothetical protein V6N11_012896 [Hibiscus sabdariffa]|uniref:Protein kinase domain-containing protein n=1 Tax=Hibiscus sabdariffa TaxID=183260 RepID=A0ABR2N955_9ROSI